ncbi:hypothetical protein [Rhizobium leguminosarum]|uniref:hypothetical protein n=1 Tax=Rhizobium leguminosarum TaxID=384 RepID=UPI003F98CDF3
MPDFETLASASIWTRLRTVKWLAIALVAFGVLSSVWAVAQLTSELEATRRVSIEETIAYRHALVNVRESLKSAKQAADQYPGTPPAVLSEIERALTEATAALEFPTYGSSFLDLAPSIVSPAFAQSQAAAQPKPEIVRPAIMIFVIVVITLFGAVCVYMYLTTADAERIKFADSMLRTIIGFYIGIVTGLLGIPPPT